MNSEMFYRILAFAGGMLVMGGDLSLADMTAFLSSLTTNINMIAGALLALSPNGVSAVKAMLPVAAPKEEADAKN